MLDSRMRLLLASVLGLVRDYLLTDDQSAKGSITMAVVTTDDFSVRLRVKGMDVDGVPTSFANLEMSVDTPTLAEVVADPNNPGAFIVRRLPADGLPIDPLMLNVTARDTATGVSATLPIEFDAGKPISLSFETELVSNAVTTGTGQATGDAGSLAQNADMNAASGPDMNAAPLGLDGSAAPPENTPTAAPELVPA